ncbi:hypothetical protein GQ55_5G539100 [Panicum hallii var. hallii]|uniref:Embryo surrounding factor 1 brassicaceae domain-containing protein n=1 Tax=Panicum hallii var. hallii TaxID=1504633 RepID=A0A2T7DTC6_9POAL|nr:hypothetical protein GQ55_5G539100 [Panicum hallii var. hallii]
MRNNNISISISISISLLLSTMLLGFVAFPAQCKYIYDDIIISSVATAISNSTTSLDDDAGRKISSSFCTQVRCNYFNPRYDFCYCCPADIRRENCYAELEECRAHCASCKPQCPLR